MGEMADLLTPDDWDDEGDLLVFYRDASSEDLVKWTARARGEKVKGIRRYWATHKRLSDKQRWCLAFWLATHDES